MQSRGVKDLRELVAQSRDGPATNTAAAAATAATAAAGLYAFQTQPSQRGTGVPLTPARSPSPTVAAVGAASSSTPVAAAASTLAATPLRATGSEGDRLKVTSFVTHSENARASNFWMQRCR